MAQSKVSLRRTRAIYLKPNSITLASSELAPNMFEVGSKLKFGLSSSLLAAN